MKKINPLNTFLALLMIATSFFGIIRPIGSQKRKDLFLPSFVKDMNSRYIPSSLQKRDLSHSVLELLLPSFVKEQNNIYLPPHLRYRKQELGEKVVGTLTLAYYTLDDTTAKKDFHDPLFWSRSTVGNVLGTAAYTMFFSKRFEPTDPRAFLVDTVLGWGFSILPYLVEKNRKDSEHILHIINHAGVQLVQSGLSCVVYRNIKDEYKKKFANVHSMALASLLIRTCLNFNSDTTTTVVEDDSKK